MIDRVRWPLARNLGMGCLALGLLAGCETWTQNTRLQSPDEFNTGSRRDYVRGRLGGSDGILIFGTDRNQQRGAAGDVSGAGIGVNAFLWRATLDTLSFMPLASADPFGGVIITDWYSPPGVGTERFRVTAYILGRTLRSDGVRVVVFRQEQQRNGAWQDVAVSARTASELEDQVLSRARELRAQSVSAAR